MTTTMTRFPTLKVCSFITVFILSFQQSFSFEKVTNNDVRALSMGDLQALSREFSNPAALSFIAGPKASVNVYNRYQMSELNSSCLSLIYPNRFLDAGIQTGYFGYDDYNCLFLHAGLAKQINDRFSIGSKISLVHLNSFLDENPQTGFSAGFGSVFYVSTVLKIGFSADNIASTFNEKNYSIHTGADYQCLENLNLASEISYNAQKQFSLSLGAEYQIIDELCFRAGIKSNPETPSLGASYSFNKIDIGVAFMTHPILGNSSMIEISYKF
ncbi:MAG: hypothetical protein LBJ72_02810 [Dysgonamonadaceae bacterium]|jgi:hypothetical protein|nr:hypothetical protein [Dysgonamonadaceae bacterium]